MKNDSPIQLEMITNPCGNTDPADISKAGTDCCLDACRGSVEQTSLSLWEHKNLKPNTRYLLTPIAIPEGYRLLKPEEYRNARPKSARMLLTGTQRWGRSDYSIYDPCHAYAVPIKPLHTIVIDDKTIELSEESYKSIKSAIAG